ncbi:MAG: DUF2846 domain-containing protein [Chitinophagaceae bacterium]|nr:DUF2846 domain-containing protein [Chitinophagaceae bacterium]
MRQTLILAIILCTFLSFTKKQNQQSYVYIFRDGQYFGALSNYSIWIDGKKVCKLSNGKYIQYAIAPGKHEIEAKVGGVGIMKKQTSLEFETTAGKDNFIACTIKTSITRQRMEMIEVVESAGKKAMKDMKPDNCQENIESDK